MRIGLIRENSLCVLPSAFSSTSSRVIPRDSVTIFTDRHRCRAAQITENVSVAEMKNNRNEYYLAKDKR